MKKEIINNEYKGLKRERNVNHDGLSKKLLDEFLSMRKEMLNEKNESLFDDHYEITLKDELKDAVLYMGLNDEDMKLLLNKEDLLTELYRDWLDTGDSLSDYLEDSVKKSINKMKNDKEAR